MKKIFTLLLALTSISLFAQRTCDLEVKMTSPVTGTVIRNGYPVNVTYSVKNLGPDKILKGDTATATLSLDGVAYPNFSYSITFTADVDAGVTFFPFNLSINFNYNTPVPAGNLCASSTIRRRVLGVQQVTDNVTSNNSSCAVVNIRSNDVKNIGKGIAVATNINASPNPANDMVNISYELVNPETVTITLFDINGRQVLESITDKQGAGSQSMQMNISELNSGLYFYEVKIGNLSERYKLMVN